MSEILVAPSLLASDFSRLKEEVMALEAAGADWMHWDVMDGHFVNNITMGPDIIKSVRPYTKCVFDVHLMISHPLQYIETFVKAGADRITFHVEAEDPVDEVLKCIHSFSIKAGLSLRPSTELSKLLPYLDEGKDLVDMVLVMTVEPGFGGQSFLEAPLEKVKALKKHKKTAWIQVDGGLNEKSAPLCVEAGANVLVAGSYIFSGDHPAYQTPVSFLKSL